MHVVTDLHLHSKYSRAVSPQMILPMMSRVAKQKGLQLLSASDFTHPIWFKEISLLLEEAGDGVYTLKEEAAEAQKTYFLMSTEIACIYKHNDKLRRIHNLIFVPSLQIAEKVTAALLKKGANLAADGRPIIGISSRNLLELLLEVDERCFLIPCHIWTPHFGIYGNASGYGSLQEAFEDLTPYIYGIETGLSSDPDMNWSVKELRTRSILSFSDAHSAPKMAREASVFELAGTTPSFTELKKAIMRPALRSIGSRGGIESIEGEKRQKASDTSHTFDTSDTSRLLYTVEFYPEEGKYHFSGHRNCNVSYGPAEIREKGTNCPVCRRKMTEGVLVRVQQLSDEAMSHRLRIETDKSGVQWFTDSKKEHPPYVKLVPLLEIVAEGMQMTVNSQKVKNKFETLITKCGSELDILLELPLTEIEKVGGDRIAEGVRKVRAGDIVIEPGFDGEYGKVSIWREGEKSSKKDQNQLSLEF